MNAITQFFIRQRGNPAIGGAGVDTSREGGYVASHYRYYRKRPVNPLTAQAAYRQAQAMPAIYTQGHEYYGLACGGAGAPSREGGDTFRWIENPAAAGIRFIAWSDEIAPRSISHRGWYCDASGHDVLRGGVWQLPGRKGKARLVYGYSEFESWYSGRRETNAGTVHLCVSDITLADRKGVDAAWDIQRDIAEMYDVARLADSAAENEAERRREYSEAYSCGANAARADQEATDGRKAALRLIREYKAAARDSMARDIFAPAMAALKDKVISLLDGIADERRKRDASWADCVVGDESAWTNGFMDVAGFLRAVRLGYAERSDWQGAPDGNPCGPLATAAQTESNI